MPVDLQRPTGAGKPMQGGGRKQEEVEWGRVGWNRKEVGRVRCREKGRSEWEGQDWQHLDPLLGPDPPA